MGAPQGRCAVRCYWSTALTFMHLLLWLDGCPVLLFGVAAGGGKPPRSLAGVLQLDNAELLRCNKGLCQPMAVPGESQISQRDVLSQAAEA